MKKQSDIVAPLLAAIRDVLAWFRSARVPAILIGGVAASLQGRPRVTNDVDALVLVALDQWDDFLQQGKRFGIFPRIPDALAFARTSRVLLLKHEASGVEVDVSFGAMPFEEESIARAKKKRVGGITMPLATPEDLIVMKAIAHRSKDVADIQGLLDAQTNIDLHRVRHWTKLLTDILEAPELAVDLDRMLSKYEANRKLRKRQ